MFPKISRDEVVMLTTEQMIEVDRAAIEDFGLLLIQMMENAGRGLALVTRALADGDVRGKNILVMAGAGGNGGGALVAARRLANFGANITLALGQEPENMTKIPAHQLALARNMGLMGGDHAAKLDVFQAPYDLILDGLIGYSLAGMPTGLIGDMIVAANAHRAKIVSLDAPSGVDTTTGRAYDPSILATATVTLALPKIGLYSAEAVEKTGRIFLADLSIPRGVYTQERLKIDPGLPFHESDIIELI